MSNKNNQKLLDSAKKFMTDAIESASKRIIHKTVEATSNLTGNKLADKTTSISKSPKELHSQNDSKELHSKTDENEIEMPKERYICPEKRESAKLRALRAKNVLTCLRALPAYVLTCLACYALTCQRALHPYVLTC